MISSSPTTLCTKGGERQRHQINMPVEMALQELPDPQAMGEPNRGQMDGHVDIAVGSVVAAGDAPEHPDIDDAKQREFAAQIAQERQHAAPRWCRERRMRVRLPHGAKLGLGRRGVGEGVLYQFAGGDATIGLGCAHGWVSGSRG